MILWNLQNLSQLQKNSIVRVNCFFGVVFLEKILSALLNIFITIFWKGSDLNFSREFLVNLMLELIATLCKCDILISFLKKRD